MPLKGDKMQEDFSEQVDALIPRQNELAKEGKLREAIENLLSLEKLTRQAEDHLSTSKLSKAIIRLCYEAQDWNLLNEQLHVLAKRRGQLRSVVQEFVKEAMTYLEPTHDSAHSGIVMDKQHKLELINTLRSISEGKMYVEIERARLTRMLAKLKEEEGKISEAADIIQEIQVETFGQMDKLEKTDFILEQMRLCLDKKDYIKAQIISNKISRKTLQDKDHQDLKLRYYSLMIRYYSHDSQYLEICKCYHAMYNTPKCQEDESQWKRYLQMTAIYLCLAPFDHEQSDLIHRVYDDKKIQLLPIYKLLLKMFLTKEIMRWPIFETSFAVELNQYSLFTESSTTGKNKLWEDLRKRVIEHNVRIVAEYYERISMKRLTELLNLSELDVEKFISELVSAKTIYAKMNRPKGIVSFRRRQDPNEVLNEWAGDVNHLLSILERTSHMIHKEQMIHQAIAKDAMQVDPSEA